MSVMNDSNLRTLAQIRARESAGNNYTLETVIREYRALEIEQAEEEAAYEEFRDARSACNELPAPWKLLARTCEKIPEARKALRKARSGDVAELRAWLITCRQCDANDAPETVAECVGEQLRRVSAESALSRAEAGYIGSFHRPCHLECRDNAPDSEFLLAFKLAEENNMQQTFSGRRSAPIAITDGKLPGESATRSHRNESELRIFRDVAGREIRSYAANQHLEDFAAKRCELSDGDIGNALWALATGNVSRYSAEVRALSEGNNVAGGFTVPDHVNARLLDLARAKSRILNLGAQTLEMNSDRMVMAGVASDPTISHVGENATIPTSDMTFNQIGFNAHKFAVIVPVSNELMDDSIVNIGEVVMTTLSSAMASHIDNLCINGIGGSEGITGLLNKSNISETGSITTLDFDDLIDAVTAIRALEGEPNGVLLDPAIAAHLAKVKNAETGEYLRPPEMVSALTFADTTKMPATSILIGAFEKCMLAIRSGAFVEFSRTAGTAFQADQTWFRIIMRADFNIERPWFHKLSGTLTGGG